MQKHNDDTIRTSGHSSLEKYTSHFIERVVCERELETEQNCNILTPNSSGYNSISFPIFLGCSTEGLVLIPASSLQLIWTSCRRGYIIIWSPPTSCERRNSPSIQPVDSQGNPSISSTGCTCYLHRCIFHLRARPGRRSICNISAFLLSYIQTSFGVSKYLVLEEYKERWVSIWRMMCNLSRNHFRGC